MTAPTWSQTDLIKMYRDFLEMRQKASVDERRALSFRLALCRASMVRLKRAAIDCIVPVDLRADILQDATLLLVETLSAESLAYVDRGANDFGSWYWTIGYHACQRAAKGYRSKGSHVVAYVNPEYLVECPEAPHVDEHPFDLLSRAISKLPDGPERNVILDWTAGLTVRESARRRGVPPRTVDWLRKRGRRLMRELCAGDVLDGE